MNVKPLMGGALLASRRTATTRRSSARISLLAKRAGGASATSTTSPLPSSPNLPKKKKTKTKSMTIKDTLNTKNIVLELVEKGSGIALGAGSSTSTTKSNDDMEGILRDVATDMGLYVSHVTTLSQKKYPGNRHWHFKQECKDKTTTCGCLDVTYWPQEAWLWISVRQREPAWVHQAGSEMKKRLESLVLYKDSTPSDE